MADEELTEGTDALVAADPAPEPGEVEGIEEVVEAVDPEESDDFEGVRPAPDVARRVILGNRDARIPALVYRQNADSVRFDQFDKGSDD